MSKKSMRQRGNEGEDIAAAFLEAKGYTILERNYFFERAEVDIVAFEENMIVFVEVKIRKNTRFGQPAEFVTPKKQALVLKAAEAWLYERKMTGSPVRFDVIGIIQHKNEAPDIQHFEHAFRQQQNN
jgi:putative endonuclease